MEQDSHVSRVAVRMPEFVATDPELGFAMSEEIMNPPNNKVKLKPELVRRLSASQEEKSHRLSERKEIEDRKPSQFLRHLLIQHFRVPDEIPEDEPST